MLRLGTSAPGHAFPTEAGAMATDMQMSLWQLLQRVEEGGFYDGLCAGT